MHPLKPSHPLTPLHPLDPLNPLNLLSNLNTVNDKDNWNDFWSIFWEKNSEENVIFVLLYWWRRFFCRQKDKYWNNFFKCGKYEEFFDGRWNNVHVIFWANMNLHEAQYHAKVLSHCINMFLEHSIQDVMVRKRQYNIRIHTRRLFRYT